MGVVLVASAVAWLAAERIQASGEASGALQDPDVEVATPELIAALPRALRETSGLAIAETSSLLWTHNDSGDDAVLYGVNMNGAVVARLRLEGVRARDFEDIDRGPCRPRWGQPSCLYVADTGNNDRERRTMSVYILPEPAADAGDAVRTTEAARVRFRYPDYRSDVEALAVTSGGDLYLVSKGRLAGIRGYRIAASEVERTADSEERAQVEALGELPLAPSSRLRRLVTGGTFVNDSLLVLRTYEGVYGFRVNDDGFTLEGGCTIRPQEPGGEGIAHEGGDAFLLTSEGGGGRSPSLHRIVCRVAA